MKIRCIKISKTAEEDKLYNYTGEAEQLPFFLINDIKFLSKNRIKIARCLL